MAGQKNFEQTTQEMMQAYLSSDYEGALEISEQACIDFPEQIALPLIWRISLLSRLNRIDESLRLFADCLEEGYWWPRAFFEDEDLDNVRELPEFQRLVDASYERSLEEADKHAPKRFIVEPSKDTTAPLPLLITMHGMGHDGQSELDFWGKASEAGWLVASLQSSQLY